MGIAELPRERAREQLRFFDAMVISQARAEDRRDWVRIKSILADEE